MTIVCDDYPGIEISKENFVDTQLPIGRLVDGHNCICLHPAGYLGERILSLHYQALGYSCVLFRQFFKSILGGMKPTLLHLLQ
jgi:hypothetical protein